MNHQYKYAIAIAFISTLNNTDAFSIALKSKVNVRAPLPIRISSNPASFSPRSISPMLQLSMKTGQEQEQEDSEIDRLRAMAAKLRAEASILEANKAQQLADAAETAFRQFDTNKDGEISVTELKAGLEKALKTNLSEQRVQELMKEFDASGDGALQLDEFVVAGVDKFRNKLEEFSREEKRLASEAQKLAQKEKEIAAKLEAKAAILNDKPPTGRDRYISLLPYLLPLMDGLQYGRFLLGGADGSADAGGNIFVAITAILYSLYRSVPFSGLIAFFVLQFLGGNLGINRLVRFNMQQAIYLDIALFFPGLLTGIIGLAAGGAGVQIPEVVIQLSTDAIFITLLAALGYSSVSSILGIEPNKIPFISQAVEKTMPTLDMFDIDSEGRLVPLPREKDGDDEEKKM